jgi:hypothetical protein
MGKKSGARLIAIFLAASSLTLTTLAPTQGASVMDLLPDGLTSKGYLGVDFSERQPTFGENVSIITSNLPAKPGTPPSAFLCSSIRDTNCSKGTFVTAQLILPPCESANQLMCIDGLSIGTSAADMEPAVKDHEVKSLTTPADATLGLPRGGGPSLWKSAKFANKSGNFTYGVIARVVYSQNREFTGAAGKVDAPLSLTSMRLSVIPVTQKAGKYYPQESYAAVNADGGSTFGIRPTQNDFDDMSDCAWTESGFCAKYEDFADNTRAALTIRMGAEMTGWLYGRMKDVDVKVDPIDAKNNRIIIEAAPVNAPGAFGYIKKSELASYPKIDARVRLSSGEFGYNQMMQSDGSLVGGYDPVGNFEDFAAFEPILKTKRGYRAQWVISAGVSVNGYQATSGNACFDDKTQLLGIVTTNALVYSPSAPEFKDGALNYKVAGLHVMEDGKTLTRGSYDLAIRSSVARCVYGFSSAPFQASVSVINADGSEQIIGTETVREDAKREWLFLSAKNFTFSTPTIRVKLTQEKAAVNAPTPVKQVATKSITCVKGKMVKKVTAVSPKCPAGYKKK